MFQNVYLILSKFFRILLGNLGGCMIGVNGELELVDAERIFDGDWEGSAGEDVQYYNIQD